MVKIITDRAADMPAAETAALGIEVAPLFINFPEGPVDSAELEAGAFYDRLAAMFPEIPTTAQPSPGIFAGLYNQAAAEPVLSVHISSGLSGTIQAATIAAGDVDQEVTVVDTMTLSGGQRYQVLFAAQAVAAGWTIAQIVERLAQIRAATEVAFTLETLEYLARGGRIGRVQALAGSLLNIKPVIRVAHEDGKYSTVSKARTLQRCMAQIVDFLAQRYGDEPLRATVMHGQLPVQAEALSALLREKLSVVQTEVLRVSPVLGVHTGPGVVGAAVVPQRLMEL
ncbi:MAG: DegV family protein [Anaerolineae bacterium]|nr:DegV family protein [Anaerolineae bacterium]